MDCNITRIRILTRCQNVKDIYDKFKARSSKVQKTFPYSEIVEDCVFQASLLKEVHLEYVRGDDAVEVALKTKEIVKEVKKPDMPGKWKLKKETPGSLPKSSEDLEPKVAKNQEASPKYVYIGGVCRGRGYTNAKAVYSVFWESCKKYFEPLKNGTCFIGSPLNQQGPVYGIANNVRTKLLGVKVALNTALQKGIPSIIVRVDDQTVYDTLNNTSSPIGNRDLLNDIAELYGQMKVCKLLHNQ